MKKWIALTLAFIMALGMAGCGNGENDIKNKLVGSFSWHDSFYGDLGNQYVGKVIVWTDQYHIYEFEKDNTVKVAYIMHRHTGSTLEYQEWTGKYEIKDEEIVLSLTNTKELKWKNSNDCESAEYKVQVSETIPFYINEYTHELILKPDRDGNSEYVYQSTTNLIDTIYSNCLEKIS